MFQYYFRFHRVAVSKILPVLQSSSFSFSNLYRNSIYKRTKRSYAIHSNTPQPKESNYPLDVDPNNPIIKKLYSNPAIFPLFNKLRNTMQEKGFGDSFGAMPSFSVLVKMMRDQDIKILLEQIEAELKKAGLDTATMMKLVGQMGFGKSK